MANEQHLKWLKEGVEAWNARMAQEWFQADLRGANLSRANLSRANLSGAKLRTLVYSARGTTDASRAEYTDLSTATGLDQDQLDSLLGDNGTVIPTDLARPEHWETIELPPDHPNYEGPDEDELANHSPANAALKTSFIKAASLEVDFTDEGIGARIPDGQELSFSKLPINCSDRLDALVENAQTIAKSKSNLGQDLRDDLTAYADHVTHNDPANPHRLAFLASGIVAETTDPMKVDALSDRVRILLANFQAQHHEFLVTCVPDVAEAVETKAQAELSRTVSKQEATAILDTLDQSIRDTEAVMTSMTSVLEDLREFDDELNALETKVFTAADKAKLQRAVDGETKELAAIASRVYHRAKQVLQSARTVGGDVAIVVSVSGQPAAQIARQIVDTLRPLMEKLGELLTVLPPV